MKKLENNILAKITLSLVSLILTLIIVEVSLKTVGYLYNLSFQTEYIPTREQLDYDRDTMYEKYNTKSSLGSILTIGDSFTNAGNVQREYSYPHQLFKILNTQGRPSKVLNMGLCEDSTFNVKKRLQNYLEKNPNDLPSKVIILIGAADNYERFQIPKKVEEIEWYDINTEAWYKTLSIYKVIRHIKYHYIQKSLEGDITPESRVSSDEFQNIKNKYIQLKEIIKLDSPQGKKAFREIKAKLPPSFIKYCENLHISFNNEHELLHSLVVYMSKILTSNYQHDEALQWLLDLAVFQPKYFWGGTFDDAYFRIVQTFQFQSSFNENDIIEKLEATVKEYPEVSKIEHFREFYELVKNKEVISTETNTRRRSTWDEINKLSKQYEFQLYLMNYPSDYASANSMIKEVSKKYSIPLLNNHKFFSKLVSNNQREKYLEDDDHLTPLGYKLMAEEVAKLISD